MPLSHGLKKIKIKRGGKPILLKTLRSPCCKESQGPQSDFSFSFMCKKTMLKMKSPAIMEKALA